MKSARLPLVGLLGIVLATSCTGSPSAAPTAAPKADTGKSAATAPAVAAQATSPAGSAAPKSTAPSPVPATKTAPAPSPGAPAASPAAAGTGQVTFTAQDYSFAGPDTVPAGWTSIRLVNQGREPHHLTLLKLTPGKTLDDFRSFLRSGGPPPAGLFTEEGGPNGIAPGIDGTAQVNLEPGTYILACFIPSPDGMPHIAKGMVKPLVVSGTAATAPTEPRETVTIDAVDFGFRLTPQVTAGTQVFRFNNGGNQHHEAQLVRLAPGKTVRDVVAFFEPPAGSAPPSGPPPGELMGGISALDQGDHAYFNASITPGSYGLLCFLPDVTGAPGTTHISRGMYSQFNVP